MKSTRKWIAAIMAVLMLVLMAACGNGGNAANENKAGYRTLEEIKAAGTINIGVFSDKNPFGYVDENGEYQGYDVYFARRLAEDLGVKVNFISTEAANRIEYLKTGKVDVILANFTVTPARAEEVDFALPYMNVALGVVSPEGRVITTLEDWNAAAWANDNTEVLAYAMQNPGYVVGIPTLGGNDTIAPAVTKGNTTLLDWLNEEIKALGEEKFFHADYEATLADTYGLDYEDELVVEGGVTAG